MAKAKKQVGNIEKKLQETVISSMEDLENDALGMICLSEISLNKQDIENLKNSERDRRLCGPALDYITADILENLDQPLTTEKIHCISVAIERVVSRNNPWLKRTAAQRKKVISKIASLADELGTLIESLGVSDIHDEALRIRYASYRAWSTLDNIPMYSKKPADPSTPRRTFIGVLWSGTDMTAKDIGVITSRFFPSDDARSDMTSTVENTIKRLQKQGIKKL